MAITHPRVHQINVSDGGVPKLPVPKAYITIQGVAGDRQRSAQYHGGVERAVCLYSLEVIEALQAEGRGGAPGSCAENRTLAGLDWTRLTPAHRLRIGRVERLTVRRCSVPCRRRTKSVKGGNGTR